jgi:hypothetical protein
MAQSPQRRVRIGFFWLFPGISIFVCSGLTCPLAQGGPGAPGGPTTQAKTITLQIINQSGLDVTVHATFHFSELAVRETTRLLAPDGIESVAEVLPTTTDFVHIVAREGRPPEVTGRSGDVLAEEEIPIGADVEAGTTITFIIPAPILNDCNGNGAEDAADISQGVSQDCNLNGIPDECESPTSVFVVVAELQHILRFDSSGGPSTDLIDLGSYGLGNLRKMDLDVAGGYIYFTTTSGPSDGTVQRIPLNGGTPTQLIGSQVDIGGIGLDLTHQTMYWSSFSFYPSGFRVARAWLDGSTVTDVVTGLGGAVAKPFVDAAGGKLYFTLMPIARAPGLIKRADLDGGNLTTVVADAAEPQDLELWPEANLMLWADYGAGGGIFRADLDGNQVQRIADVPYATGVAIDRDNCKVYWCSEGLHRQVDGFVERANLDGSLPERLLDGLDSPQDIALYPAAVSH